MPRWLTNVRILSRSLTMKALPSSEVYQLLEPGPVVLLTTARHGRANIMTMSWHMMVEFEPPLVGCVVSSANHSFAALRATGECVIAVPALELGSKVVDVGNCSGRDVDKFVAFGLRRFSTSRRRASGSLGFHAASAWAASAELSLARLGYHFS